MPVAVFIVAFVAIGLGVVFVAFFGGPSGARQAYLTRGRRAFRIFIPIFYIALGIAVPALVIASRQSAEGKNGTLASSQGNAKFDRGKTLFRETCWSCHTLKAAGAQGVTGPNLDQRVTSAPPNNRVQFVLNAIKVGGTGDGRMPAQLLTGANAQAVAYYVAKVAGK